MSNDNLWDEEESFSDMPEEAQTGADGKPVPQTVTQTQHQYAPPVVPPRAPAPTHPALQEVTDEELEASMVEEDVEEGDEDFSDVLSDANLRLEQGSLYKLVMKHDLFENSDADPKAIQNVQKAIRKFAREQMEVMLGMRPEVVPAEKLEIQFPFNELEVEVLKAMARTFSKGATEKSENYVPSVIRTTEEPKRNILNPIGGSAPAKKKPVTKKLPSKPAAPIKRSKIEDLIDFYASQEADGKVSKETIKAGLMRELAEHDQLLGRPVGTLTVEELAQRNQTINQRRGALAKSPQAIPMPSSEEAAALVERNTPAKPGNKLIELALKMPPSKMQEPGE
jgi:hypothetical protein